jgi:hypothetical protein
MVIPKRLSLVLSCLLLAVSSAPGAAIGEPQRGDDRTGSAQGPANGVVLLIRHAERPVAGPGLGSAGEQRAVAYVRYFGDFRVDGTPARIRSLVATADSVNSSRPRLTLVPLGQALGLPILPHGSWPDDVYDWVIALRFDARGHLVTARRIVEPALLPSATR